MLLVLYLEQPLTGHRSSSRTESTRHAIVKAMVSVVAARKAVVGRRFLAPFHTRLNTAIAYTKGIAHVETTG